MAVWWNVAMMAIPGENIVMPLLPTKPLPTLWDSLFAKYSGNVPVSYLRALSKRESNMNPNQSVPPAYGLMQVVPVVVSSYNNRYGTNYTIDDVLNPDLNVKMATGVLNRIVTAYAKHSDPNMKPDWSNPEFVNLVTAGWNSGYSEAAGVGKVASWLEAKGIPVTHDNVFKYAAQAGGVSHLQNEAKRQWQKTVTDLYFRQPDSPDPGSGKGVMFTISAALAAALGFLGIRYLQRKK